MERLLESVTEQARNTLGGFLTASANAGIIEQIEASLGLSRLDIERGYMRYSLESLASHNDIYNDIAIHVAMWIEYQTARSLHARRQAVILDEVQRWRPKSIADIGFGAPTQYLRDYVICTPSVTANLFDKYPAALAVGRTIIKYWDGEYSNQVQFTLHDMDIDPPILGFDCYLMLDSIEHAAEPDRYLRQTVSAAHPDALFLFHIPIGPLITSHTIAWENQREATQWLTMAGLKVSHTELILPNHEVDHFSHGETRIENLFIVARKRSRSQG